MAQELEKLIVTLEANLKNYEKELARAQKVTVSQLRKIEREAKKSATLLEQGFGRLGRSVQAGLAGLITIGTLNKLKDMVKGVADLAEQAQIAGVSIEDLQRLKFVGVTVGVDTEQLVSAVSRFNKLLGESQAKGEGLVDLFKEHGVEIEDNTQAFLALGDMIRNAETAQERAVIATKAMGKAGQTLIPLFMQGTDALEDMMKQADAAGAVIDTELVRAADDFYDRWAVKISSWYTFLSGHVAKAAISLETLFSDISTVGINQLGLRIKELQDRLNDPIRIDFELKSLAPAGSGAEFFLDAAQKSTAELTQELEEAQTAYRELLRLQALQKGQQGPGGGEDAGVGEEVQKVIDALIFEQQQLKATALQQAINTELRKADVDATSEQGQAIVKLVTANFNAEAAQKAATAAGEEANQKKKEQADSIADVMSALEDERMELLLSANEYEIYQEIVKAGVAVDSEAAQKIREKVTALQALRAAQEGVNDRNEQFQQQNEQLIKDLKELEDAFKGAFGDLAVAAADGKLQIKELTSTLEGLRDQLIRLAAEKLFVMAINLALGRPPTALAEGGPVTKGKRYIVGEEGPELFVPNEPGEIIPADDTAKALNLARRGPSRVRGTNTPPMTARASGGPVLAGQTYKVGERGPEMFIPKQPGTIVPAGGEGAAPIINIINQPGVASTQSMTRRGGRDVVEIVNRQIESRFPELLNRNSSLISAKPASRRTV